MTLNRIEKGRCNFCQSCSKEIIDFRGKTTNEIIGTIEAAENQVCGIYDSSQLAIKQFSIKNAIFFKLLAFAALIGFNVKPLKAQSEKIEGIPPKSSSIVFKEKPNENTYQNRQAHIVGSIQTAEVPKKKLFKKRKKKSVKKVTIGYL